MAQYKILLVDDEVDVRESIARTVDWEACGFSLCGCAAGALEALEMAYKAIDQGAHGVDMGRNIFQSDCPAGMAQAIGKVVHEGYTPKQAYEVYQEVKNAQ